MTVKRAMTAALFSLMIVSSPRAGGLARQPATPKSEAKPLEKFALLVGINDYEHVPKLKGAVQDVTDLRALLESNRFAFAKDHIVTLTDRQATAQAIIDSFKTHLIENARKNPNAIVVFHYSGHGSFVEDTNGDELDKYDETLVTAESRDKEGKNFDITDDEIFELFRELAGYTENITFIFDSCHSGTVNRGSATAREVPKDQRPQPKRELRVQRGGKSPDAKAVDLLPSSDRYVTITGCRPNEKSYEIEKGERHHGAMTFYLIETLKRARPDTTYRDVMKEVARAVNLELPYQDPQVEGNLRQKVFGGSANPEDHYIELRKVEGKTVTLGAGAAQGLKVGSMIAIYEPGTYRLIGEEKKLANGVVTQVKPLTAAAEIADVPEGKVITTDARATLISPLYGGTRLRVGLGPFGAARIDPGVKLIASLADGLKESRLVEVVSAASRGAAPGADVWDAAVMMGKFGDVFKYRQIARPAKEDRPLPAKDADVYYIATRDAEALFGFFVEPDDPQAARKLAVAMEKLARLKNLLALENQVSPINGAIKMTVLRVAGTFNADGKLKVDSETPVILADNEQDYEFDQGIYYRIQIENQSGEDLYVTLFNVGTNGSIAIMFPPEGARDPVRRGSTVRTTVYVTTPPAGNEVFKVIAATSYGDFRFLEQIGVRNGAPSPLEMLMSQALEGTRQGPARPRTKLDEWGTAQIRLLISTTKAQ